MIFEFLKILSTLLLKGYVLSKQQKTILKYTLIISIAIFSSRILGLVREVIQTNYFGLSAELAAFKSARLIPNLLRELLAEGAFSTAFITVFAGMIGKKNKEDILIFVNKAILIAFLLSTFVLIVLFFISPYIVPLLHKTEKTIDLTIELFRIMLPFIAIMSISSIFMGFLNSHNKFGIPAWAPFISNIIFIIIILLFKESWGIQSLSIALICGGLAQFLFQVPSFFKTGFRLKLVNLKLDENLKKFFKLFFPFALTMAIPMLYNIVSNPIVTKISEYGNVSLNNSFILVRFVLSVVAISIGTVSLPNLSKHHSNNDYNKFTDIIKQALTFIIVISIPVVVGAMLLSERAISFVWRDFTFGLLGKRIGDSEVSEIACSLFYYSPGILFSGLNAIIHRGFQSMQMWKTPLVVGLCTVILHYFMSNLFTSSLGYHGIALSFSIVSMINFAILFTILQLKMQIKIKLKNILPSLTKSVISASIMIIVIYCFDKLIGNLNFLENVYLNRIVIFITLILIGAVIYFLLMIFFKENTVRTIFKRITKSKND